MQCLATQLLYPLYLVFREEKHSPLRHRDNNHTTVEYLYEMPL